MQKPSPALGAFVGFVTGLAHIGLSFLGNRLAALPFLPFDLFDWLARVLPGAVVTAGIDGLVTALSTFGFSVSETAKLAEQSMALAMVVFAGVALGVSVALLRRAAQGTGTQLGAAAGVALFVLFFAVEVGLGLSASLVVTLLWLLLLTVGWGAVIGYLLDSIVAISGETAAADTARRDALLKLAGGSLGLALGSWWLGRLSESSTTSVAESSGAGQPLRTPTAGSQATQATPQPSVEFPPTPSGRLEVAPGTRSEITSNDAFYRIDINSLPPQIDGETWQLQVEGLFEQPRNLTIDDLHSYSAVTQPITLSCISNRIGGDLIGSSYWTGVRLRDVLNDLQLSSEAGALYLEAEDGFYEVVAAEDMMDERTLLVYGMNGEALPVEHGYPLRIYIPNRYGMKQPKWIVRMEAIEAWRPGYWVDRGWSREARPKIISVVDTVAADAAEGETIPVGGIAWAGDRGVQKVEVSVDNGPWVEAALRKPPLSNLTWVQWRYDWPSSPGRHTFTVRATDGTGTLQTAEESPPHPDGSTGYHSRTVSI